MTATGSLHVDVALPRLVERRELVRQAARRSLARRRRAGRIAFWACAMAVGVSLVPLVAMVAYTVARGSHALSIAFLVHNPTIAGDPNAGIANAIVGSLVILGLAMVMAIPTGTAAALFLLERRGPLADAVRFAADVLTGVPSIAIGIFAYVVLVEPIGHFSGLSGSFALAVLMFPIVIRASEAAMRAVPRDLWEAGLALGAGRARVVRSVVIRGALPGLVTANLLAMARAVGETAPLLFTAIGSSFFTLSPTKPMAAMPLVVFEQGTTAFPAAQLTAWGTALVLLALVLIMSISARIVAAHLTRRAR